MLVFPFALRKMENDLKIEYEEKKKKILNSDMDNDKKAEEIEKLKMRYEGLMRSMCMWL